FPSRKVPVFEPMRMAKGTRCPYALDSNTIPFHASASYAPIWTSEKSRATCATRDNGRSRARKIAACSHRAPRRRTRCLYRRSPVPSWLIAPVIARERLPVDLLASFICGSAGAAHDDGLFLFRLRQSLPPAVQSARFVAAAPIRPYKVKVGGSRPSAPTNQISFPRSRAC